jgi:hypothetical protein
VARLKGAKRQKNQLVLAFGTQETSELGVRPPKGPKHPWRSAGQKAWLRRGSGWRRSVSGKTSGRRSSA